ncbi:MAG: HlyD family efflux transporter periplasmic adaptor subunit [Burkholderiales bacterium]|nr:HlyD family efflux transporter periplasmic adaptor subunit [Burkholderiales bacterium]MDR4516574.1 HlyD family efflux transporter periplasmic adaptor subunit [Nitrosomonas sp.]
MTVQQESDNNHSLSILLQLEEDARNCEDLLALQYFIVNETRRLLKYRHAFLFKLVDQRKTQFHTIRASGSTFVDRSIPRIHWIERVISAVLKEKPGDLSVQIHSDQLSTDLQQDWHLYALSFPVLLKLELPDGHLIGVLWFERETAWQENELLLLRRLARTYAHAWGYFIKKKSFGSWLFSRNKAWILGGIVLALLLLPVQHSTLGPAKLVADDPWIVSAPIDGVIASVSVEPNQMVSQGVTLFNYEDTNYRNEYSAAEQSLVVAQAELRKATQGAFQDQKSKAEVSLLKSKVDLVIIKRDHALERLNHVNVVAEKKGFLLFNDKSDLIGRPVKTGERLMEIADVEKLKLRIDLPVDNNIEFEIGAPVKLYLDVNPVRSIDAIVTYIGFRAEVVPGDILVYRIEADLTEESRNLRIGWQGTAKIYGRTVNLFFYLFRRPLAAVRQYLGF